MTKFISAYYEKFGFNVTLMPDEFAVIVRLNENDVAVKITEIGKEENNRCWKLSLEVEEEYLDVYHENLEPDKRWMLRRQIINFIHDDILSFLAHKEDNVFDLKEMGFKWFLDLNELLGDIDEDNLFQDED